jgi:hypothetical protein
MGVIDLAIAFLLQIVGIRHVFIAIVIINQHINVRNVMKDKKQVIAYLHLKIKLINLHKNHLIYNLSKQNME